jgi:hypothetical protein
LCPQNNNPKPKKRAAAAFTPTAARQKGQPMVKRNVKQSAANDTATQPVGLVKKLVAIRAALGPIAKAHRNPHFGYDYVSEGQIMAVLTPHLNQHGILVTTSVDDMHVHYSDQKGAGVFVSVNTTHTFEDTETGETREVKSAGVGWDTGDKGVYKAITGATKYALMKNFLVTDEQDPEAGEQAKAARPGATGHSRTRRYEEETGQGDRKVETDLLELKAFLTEHKIPDGFLLALLQEKKLIDGHTKNVAQLKPGILQRCISPKSRENLIKAWKAHQADEASGSATAPPSPRTGIDEPPYGNDKEKAEVRTSEGDQTRAGVREPVVNHGIELTDVLAQEGYDNWRQVPIHFGKQKATTLGKLGSKSLAWWITNYKPEQYQGSWNGNDILLDAALCLASLELAGGND